MHGVIAKEMSECLDVAEIVHGDEFDRGAKGANALALDKGSDEVAADATEAVDGDTYWHEGLSQN